MRNPESPNGARTFSADGLRVVAHPRLGRQVIADRPFDAREIVAVWRGHEITETVAAGLEQSKRDQLLQIGLGTFLATDDVLSPVDYINHSCDPNCGFLDATTLVAMRPITTGESITFDYAMSDSNSFIAFDCGCGSTICRGRLDRDDWRRPDVQRRYRGWFAPHIEQLIRGLTQLAGD